MAWYPRALSLLRFETFDYSSYFVDLDRLEYYEDMAFAEPTPEELRETEDVHMEPGLPSDPQAEGGALDAAALLYERLHAIDSQPLERLRGEAEPRTLSELHECFKKMIDGNFFYSHTRTSC